MSDNKSKIKFKELCEEKTGEKKEVKEENVESVDDVAETEERKKELHNQAEQVKKENEVEKKEIKKIGEIIKVSETGELVAKNLEEKKTLALAYLRSGMLPSQYNTIEKVITGMQFVSELGLKSLTALRQTYIVNGTPNLWGDLPLALARRTGQLEFFEEFPFDKNLNKICFDNKNIEELVYGYLCRIKRRGETIIEKTFTLKNAITAKLITIDEKGAIKALKNKDVWEKYPQIMLMYKARAAALKVAFADILNGIGILEYDSDMLGDKSQIVDYDNEKEMLIEELNMVLSACRKSIPEFNSARENDMISKRIENSDIRFASKEAIKNLIEDLRDYYSKNTNPA